MKTHLALLLLGPALLLPGACGRRGELQRADGQLPPPPVWAEKSPTPAEMLEPPPQAAPLRVDETLRRSEQRPDDAFDLPPLD